MSGSNTSYTVGNATTKFLGLKCCFVVSFSSLLSHRNHRTVKWGPSEQSQVTEVMLNPNPMSSSEDNESKSYPELDKSALLVARVKLPRVFEI